MNLRLTLSYDGTGFRGWARQPGARTVEGTLAAALDARYPGWRGLAVAGRTDTGVHALGQVASVTVGDRAAGGQCRARAERGAAGRRRGARGRRGAGRLQRPLLGRAPAPTSTACGWCATPSALDARRALHHRGALDRVGARRVGRGGASARTTSRRSRRPRRSTATFVRTVHHAAWHEVGEELRLHDRRRRASCATRCGRWSARCCWRAAASPARRPRAAAPAPAPRRPDRRRRRTGCTCGRPVSRANRRASSLWESHKFNAPSAADTVLATP